MKNMIKKCLKENGFEFEENVLKIIVDCGGQDFKFISLIQLINENIEEWTYVCEAKFNVNIDLGFETVIFNF